MGTPETSEREEIGEDQNILHRGMDGLPGQFRSFDDTEPPRQIRPGALEPQMGGGYAIGGGVMGHPPEPAEWADVERVDVKATAPFRKKKSAVRLKGRRDISATPGHRKRLRHHEP